MSNRVEAYAENIRAPIERGEKVHGSGPTDPAELAKLERPLALEPDEFFAFQETKAWARASTAGVLAIALTYSGMLGKVYCEILESGEAHATTALLRNGASRLQAFIYGLLPTNAAALTSYTVYRWECAIRSSPVLGFVGAGGLGQQMDLSMKMLAGGEVATILIVFFLLVLLADTVSGILRRTVA